MERASKMEIGDRFKFKGINLIAAEAPEKNGHCLCTGCIGLRVIDGLSQCQDLPDCIENHVIFEKDGAFIHSYRGNKGKNR